MKIAIFTDTFYPMVNGVVTAALNIAKSLADRGHKILIVTAKTGKFEEFQYPGIQVKRLNSIPATFYEDFRWTSFFSFSTYKLMKDEGFDLVHFMAPFTVAYLGIKIARMLGIPVVGTFHTFISDPTYFEHFFRGILKASENMAWNYANCFYNAADLVTAPSPSTLRAMQDNGCYVKGQVISNGIDPQLFDNSQWESFRDRYKLGEKVVLYFGRIAEEKNLSVLVEGFRQAWEKDRDLQLLLIGDGPQRESLQEKMKNLPMDKNVIFTGAIPHDELIKSGVFRACKLFVTASKTENQPMTILEAQVNGMVCIGANSRGIPDLIQHGYNGLLFSPDSPEELAEALTQVNSKDELYQRLKQNTQISIEDHKLVHIIDHWENVYGDLIAQNKQGLYKDKDYLHLKTVVSLLKELKFDLSFAKKA